MCYTSLNIHAHARTRTHVHAYYNFWTVKLHNLDSQKAAINIPEGKGGGGVRKRRRRRRRGNNPDS